MGAVGAGPVPSPPSPFPYESLYPTRHRGAQGGASALGTVRTGGRANSSKGRRLRGLLPDRYKEAAANAEAAGALEAFDALYEKRFERTALAKKHWGCLSSPPHNPISIRARARTHTHTHTHMRVPHASPHRANAGAGEGQLQPQGHRGHRAVRVGGGYTGQLPAPNPPRAALIPVGPLGCCRCGCEFGR